MGISKVEISKQVKLLEKMHLELLPIIQSNHIDALYTALENCQEKAVEIGTAIESVFGTETSSVKALECYCEALYLIAQSAEDFMKVHMMHANSLQVFVKVLECMKTELALEQKVVLYYVDFIDAINEEDLIEKKVQELCESAQKHENMKVLWYMDLSQLAKKGLYRKGFIQSIQKLIESFAERSFTMLETKGNWEKALWLSDAYYGDESFLSEAFVGEKKPVMIQDRHLISNEAGYVSSEIQKSVKEVLLGIYKEFKRICDKYRIPYYAYAGTLLGAVRHQGFIPWDDDMDIMMFREDYEFFCKVAKKELGESFFLQNTENDPNYISDHATLRDTTTTAILMDSAKNDVNLGIFMDIFVLDGIPENEGDFRKLCGELEKDKQLGVLKMIYLLTGQIEKKFDAYADQIRTKSGLDIVRHMEKAIDKYTKEDSYYVGIYSEIMSGNTMFYDREFFDEVIMLPFEDTEIPVSAAYDAILRNTYGNYMNEVRAKSSHGLTFFDVDRTYQSYIM